jgi:asparagine synthase (glutamine-hydrolysing)
MNAAIAHRGPDGEGFWSDTRATFGHRRLSIIDLSERGRQPMLNGDGTLALVCNGEIYNYRDLRSRMSDEGHVFRSDTDVEVILPLYEKYGEQCVDHLVGMFAFALWDGRRRRLLLARDRVGEKPLYTAVHEDWIAFSSEVKGLLELPFVDRTLNEEAIPLLMVHQSLPAPVTMFRGIEQLPPASYATWAGGGLDRKRYWRLDYSRNAPLSTRAAVSAYEDVLGASVKESLQAADVPVGVLLSGGVDSSTIAAMARTHDRGVSSFCIGSSKDGQPNTDIRRANRVAEILGTRHNTLSYDDPELWRLPEIVRQYDQPIWNLVALYADRLAQQMSSHVKVALTGNGADEVFGGYRPYGRLPAQQMVGSIARFVPSPVGGLLGRLSPRLERFLGTTRHPFATWRGQNMTLMARQMMMRLCQPTFARRWNEYEAGRLAAAAGQECNPRSLFDAVRYTDLMVCHQHSHCVIADTSGMTHGIEMRSPFLDHRVLEFSASLPRQQLLPWPYRSRHTKLVTKRYLETILPPDLVYARKVGFGYGISFDEHLRGVKSAPVRRLLLSGRYLDLGIFSREGAEWALANSTSAVTILLCFAVWADRYLFHESAVAADLQMAT